MFGDLQAAKPLLTRGLELCRAQNDQWQIAWGLEGNFEQARQLYAETLSVKVSVMDKLGITYSLAAFAQLAVAKKLLKRAAAPWGAAEQMGETLNLLLTPSEENQYTSLIPITRAQLGENAFEAARLEGRAMKLQEAVDYALDQTIV